MALPGTVVAALLIILAIQFLPTSATEDDVADTSRADPAAPTATQTLADPLDPAAPEPAAELADPSPEPGSTATYDEMAQRRALEAKAWSGEATEAELRMLRAICSNQGDRLCRNRAHLLLKELQAERRKEPAEPERPPAQLAGSH